MSHDNFRLAVEKNLELLTQFLNDCRSFFFLNSHYSLTFLYLCLHNDGFPATSYLVQDLRLTYFISAFSSNFNLLKSTGYVIHQQV